MNHLLWKFPELIDTFTTDVLSALWLNAENQHIRKLLMERCCNAYVKRTSLVSGSLFLLNQPFVHGRAYGHVMSRSSILENWLRRIDRQFQTPRPTEFVQLQPFLEHMVKPFGEGLQLDPGVSYYPMAECATLFRKIEEKVQQTQLAIKTQIDLSFFILPKDVAMMIKSYLVLEWTFYNNSNN
jgi:hypothetical protein